MSGTGTGAAWVCGKAKRKNEKKELATRTTHSSRLAHAPSGAKCPGVAGCWYFVQEPPVQYQPSARVTRGARGGEAGAGKQADNCTPRAEEAATPAQGPVGCGRLEPAQ